MAGWVGHVGWLIANACRSNRYATPPNRRTFRHVPTLPLSRSPPALSSIRVTGDDEPASGLSDVDVCVRAGAYLSATLGLAAEAPDRDMNCRMRTARRGTNYVINREA